MELPLVATTMNSSYLGSLVGWYQQFGGIHCLHLQNMAAIGSSKMLVPSVRLHGDNKEEHNMNLYQHENPILTLKLPA